MRKGISPIYIVLAAALFCWVSIPQHITDGIRSFSVASLSPAWDSAKGIRKYLSDRPSLLWSPKKQKDETQVSQLELENAMLRAQLEKISKWLIDEERILEQLALVAKMEGQKNQVTDVQSRGFFERRVRHLQSLIQYELMAMPAEVIYRDPSSWSSSLWINVGEDDNKVLGKQVIAKNSPVVSGFSLVGVVDYVGKKQARVRLISDSGLSPAVRAARGLAQKDEIASKVDCIVEHLQGLPGKEALLQDLKSLKTQLESRSEEHYLAKGELHGSGAPLWRARSSLLKGIGFNFDYPDEEGSAPKGVPLLKKGDLLVTTGFDGVFPPDLKVGIVKEVRAPKPGGYSYEIDVRPIVDQLSDLETLFVLPPRGD